MGGQPTIAELGDLALTDAYIERRLREIMDEVIFGTGPPKTIGGFFTPREAAMRIHPSSNGPPQFD